MDFEILINDSFVDICTDETLFPTANKAVLSVVNDFEDAEWRYNHFQNFVWDNIALTALSHSEREALASKGHTKLIQAAQKLRLLDDDTKDTGRGSEIAEIVLYAIMHHHFKALPVVPKIFYKQNSKDYAKGADSVHIVVNDSGTFSIWHGEAKFYANIEDAQLNKIITSVANSLDTDKLKKENSIILGVNDLNGLIKDIEIENKIREILATTTSIDKLKPILNIPILLLHECNITKGCTEMTDEYKSRIIEHHKERSQAYFKKHINQIGTIPHYAKIKFHLILFPIPSKVKVVDAFVDAAKFYKK